MLSFKPTFSLSSFTFIKRLCSSLLSVIRVVSSAYLRLLMFLQPTLIPACVLSRPAFYVMYSAYKLNEKSDNIQPWHIPLPILNQSVVPCPVLTVASWLAYRFLRRQVRWSHMPTSLRIFHSLLWSTQSKAFRQSILEVVGVFLEFFCFFYDPVDVGSLISGSSAFSKSSLYTWKFSVQVLLKPSLKEFEHYLASMWNELNCIVVCSKTRSSLKEKSNYKSVKLC